MPGEGSENCSAVRKIRGTNSPSSYHFEEGALWRIQRGRDILQDGFETEALSRTICSAMSCLRLHQNAREASHGASTVRENLIPVPISSVKISVPSNLETRLFQFSKSRETSI